MRNTSDQIKDYTLIAISLLRKYGNIDHIQYKAHLMYFPVNTCVRKSEVEKIRPSICETLHM